VCTPTCRKRPRTNGKKIAKNRNLGYAVRSSFRENRTGSSPPDCREGLTGPRAKQTLQGWEAVQLAIGLERKKECCRTLSGPTFEQALARCDRVSRTRFGGGSAANSVLSE